MRHLHVVGPPGEKPPRAPHRAHALSLTDEEARHLRAAIRGLARTRYANLVAIGRELGVHPQILGRKRRPSAALAIAIWRLTGIPLDVLLTGKIAAVPSPTSSDPA